VPGEITTTCLCSCGSDLEDCPFWGQLTHLNGLNLNLPLVEKYAALIRFIRQHFGDDVLVTDSSKSVEALEALRSALGIESASQDRFGLILVSKDVRSFRASMKRKSGGKGLLSAFRSMNYWAHANTTWLKYLATDPAMPYRISLYEHLCLDPLGQINGLLAMVEEAPPLHPGHCQYEVSHRDGKQGLPDAQSESCPV